MVFDGASNVDFDNSGVAQNGPRTVLQQGALKRWVKRGSNVGGKRQNSHFFWTFPSVRPYVRTVRVSLAQKNADTTAL